MKNPADDGSIVHVPGIPATRNAADRRSGKIPCGSEFQGGVFPSI
jgi:hypothetical protein